MRSESYVKRWKNKASVRPGVASVRKAATTVSVETKMAVPNLQWFSVSYFSGDEKMIKPGSYRAPLQKASEIFQTPQTLHVAQWPICWASTKP